MLGHDLEAGIIVFRLLDEPSSGVELALEDRFGNDLCHCAGQMLSAVHGLPAAGLDDSELWLPPLGWLDGMPWQAVQQQTMAQLAAWRLLQDDTAVVGALRALRAEERCVLATPVHGDLRLDQFIVSGGRLYLCDWENFRRGDPARDLGAFLGECFYHATYSLFAPPKDSAGTALADAGLTHDDIIERGQESLRRTMPRIAAFWDGYLGAGEPDPALATRVMSFAGWHLFDRLVASAESHVQLSPVAKAAAGLGRSMLLNPAGAARMMGLVRP